MSNVIAIDGPAGSGKSTLGRSLALALKLPYVNTGSMYRALTHAALAAAIDPDDGGALLLLFRGIDFGLSEAAPPVLLIDGAPPVEALTSSEVEAAVSAVARHPEIRAEMAAAQRALGEKGAVMEGRDIATVIFPDAALKVFLIASAHARADRRVAERGAGDSEQLASAMAERDERDAKTNPQVAPPGALVIDTTGVDAADVLAEVLTAARERLG